MQIYRIIEVDPLNLLAGDIVIKLNEYINGGCHCDVLVTVKRYDES
jgi:hypothetical protein